MRRVIVTPTLIAHGGAGGRAPVSERPARRRAILAAVERGAAILRGGGAALDAVVATVVALEDDALFNAGYGSLLTLAGQVEMDAAVMTASRRRSPDDASAASGANSTSAGVRAVEVRAGGVVLVSRVRNPIDLARAVMERTPHLLMGGAGAEALARQAGLRMCRPADLISPRARARWLSARAQAGDRVAWFERAAGSHGTVGAVAIDSRGDVAAATSTGGVTGKLAGRIGDSAIVGAGLFANARGGASATGHGEAIMHAALCREVVGSLARNSAQAAAERAIAALAGATSAQAGVIVADARGGLGYAHNAQAMEVAFFHPHTGLHHRRLAPLVPSAAARLRGK